MAAGNVSSALATTVALINTLTAAKVTYVTDQVNGNLANLAADFTAVNTAQAALASNLNSVWGLTLAAASSLVLQIPSSASGAVITAIVNSAAALQAL